MNTIDVRNNKELKADKILFADEGYDVVNAIGAESDFVTLYSDADDNEYPYVNIRIADIPNFMKALKKAEELGWIPAKKPAAATKKKVPSKKAK